jgi:biopolymer transport protein ExbD
MLAATVALSPVITTSVVFQPTNVEAATVSQEIDVLAERFFGFYKHAGSYGFAGTPTAAINGLTYAQIQSTATSNGISLNVPVAKQADFENLMKNTAKLIYTKHATAADLAEAVKSFKTANSGYFNSLFDEDGNVFADQLILFVKDLESQLELAIMDAKTPTFSAIISAAVRNTFANGANKAQYANIDGKLGNVGLSVEGLFLLQEKLNDNFVDTNKNLRSAMLQSAFQEKGAYIERNTSNNQFTLFVPIKFINDFINVPLRGSIHWQTSNPSVATFSGNTLTAVSTGTVNVYATIDGLKLATFENVSVTVTPPVIPGPGPDPDPNPPDDRNEHIKDSTEVTKGEPDPVTGQVDVVTKVKSDKVEEIIAKEISATDNTIPIILQVPKANEQVKAQIPASLFTKAEAANPNADAIIEVKTDEASYRLPASEINATELATKLGVPAGEDFEIVVSVNVKERVTFQDGIKVVSKVVEFVVEAVYKDKREPLENFNGYVERTIVGEEDFDPNKAVGVKVNPDGSVTPVPTTFAGKTATFNSLTNSLYTVIGNDITFTDVNKPWHEKLYIETLANKLIIQGYTDSQGNRTFAPGNDMTRAQFTTMLVKALALPSKKSEKTFPDVKESDSFKDALDTAVGYGIISGKPDGRFAPNEPVTRSQVAIMLHRTMQLSFMKDLAKVNPDKKEFTDVAKLDAKTKEAIDALYQAGIISGKPDGSFDPNGKTIRNQMAKMLAEFLISAKLMNDIK